MENFPNCTFTITIFRFSSKFLMTFFSHWLQMLNFPLFSLFQYISPLFPENDNFPLLLLQIPPPAFVKCTCFLHTLCDFCFPPSSTMMRLCITQCTFWTPLALDTTCIPSYQTPIKWFWKPCSEFSVFHLFQLHQICGSGLVDRKLSGLFRRAKVSWLSFAYPVQVLCKRSDLNMCDIMLSNRGHR